MTDNQSMMNGYRQRNWEAIGALSGVPEERHGKVLKLLDETLGFVIKMEPSIDITRASDGKTLTPEQVELAAILMFPTITRISGHVDIDFDDVRKIYADIEFGVFDFIEKNMELAVNNIDLEAEFVAHYCDKFVEANKEK